MTALDIRDGDIASPTIASRRTMLSALPIAPLAIPCGIEAMSWRGTLAPLAFDESVTLQRSREDAGSADSATTTPRASFLVLNEERFEI